MPAARAACLLALLALLVPAIGSAAPPPNFVVILTDDQTAADVAYMPRTLATIAGQGMRFERSYVEVAWCGPSRASLLTGRYAHNTRIYNNEPATGGFWKYRDYGLAEQSLPYWLRGVGYETGLVGKFINGYGGTAATTVVPAGWSYWVARRDTPDPQRNFNYSMYENGRVVSYGAAATDYATDVYLRKAKEFLKRATARHKPFFLLFAPQTPHTPAEPAPRHARMFSGAKVPRSPSFREADMSDKPSHFQALALGDGDVRSLDSLQRARLRSLQAVDEAVADIVDLLTITGVRDNTYILFTSDNGFHLGQHNLPANKQLAYEEDIRVPLLIRGPGIPAGSEDSRHIVLNVDIAPTIAGLAGIRTPANVDGRSLAPLWSSESGPATWRRAFPVARWPKPAPDPFYGLSITGVRTLRHTWVEWSNGQRELYDNLNDPWQIASQHDANGTATLRAQLSSLASALAACSGKACRDLEDAAP